MSVKSKLLLHLIEYLNFRELNIILNKVKLEKHKGILYIGMIDICI